MSSNVGRNSVLLSHQNRPVLNQFSSRAASVIGNTNEKMPNVITIAGNLQAADINDIILRH